MYVIPFYPDTFEPIEERVAVVEGRVSEDACGEGKGEEVGDSVCCWEVERGVRVVCGWGEEVSFEEDASDVVRASEAVKGLIGRDGKVGELPSL